MANKDLFDDSVMSFGEHLEILRVHLIKALLGLVLAVLISLYYSKGVVIALQKPVQNALTKYYGPEKKEVGLWERIESWWKDTADDQLDDLNPDNPTKPVKPAEPQVTIDLDINEVARALHAMNPSYPAPPKDAGVRLMPVTFPQRLLTGDTPVAEAPLMMATTLTPEEAFVVYMKVALVTGLVVASPWVIYQIWLFVAAGLYPQERKYVYIYLPMSLALFIGGALLCFYGVIPYVLDFLFSFNKWLNLKPEIRITEWVSFAAMLPIMFGVSFQLPLVMLFLEKINVFRVEDYREKRRISILVISIVSMVLTPSDPISMLMMMCPLIVLYEFGILLCGASSSKSPFEEAAA